MGFITLILILESLAIHFLIHNSTTDSTQLVLHIVLILSEFNFIELEYENLYNLQFSKVKSGNSSMFIKVGQIYQLRFHYSKD